MNTFICQQCGNNYTLSPQSIRRRKLGLTDAPYLCRSCMRKFNGQQVQNKWKEYTEDDKKRIIGKAIATKENKSDEEKEAIREKQRNAHRTRPVSVKRKIYSKISAANKKYWRELPEEKKIEHVKIREFWSKYSEE
ncbi:MAG: hypothetical protein HXL53_05565, partial [Solobacterium sp.]|nr:hypothetical protein [Solobacterium sp.]